MVIDSREIASYQLIYALINSSVSIVVLNFVFLFWVTYLLFEDASGELIVDNC